MCSANICNSRIGCYAHFSSLFSTAKDDWLFQVFQQILSSSHSLTHFRWDNLNKHLVFQFFKLTPVSMTETGWRAITQATPMAKVQKERNEEKAEHRNIIHEHSWIQNLIPSNTLPTPCSHQADNYSLPQSFSLSFREIHTTYDCALNFLLSYILSVIFNLFFFSFGNMKNIPYLFWRRRIMCLRTDLPEIPVFLLMNLRDCFL